MKFKLLVFALALITISSCEKDSTKPETTKTKTPEELLTAHTWKADEIRSQLSNNTTAYYKRGGTTNTINYDSDSLKFNNNNTGIYYYLGAQYTTTWNFINPEKSKMTLIINYTDPLIINLENVIIDESHLNYTQYSTKNGVSYLASGRRVPN